MEQATAPIMERGWVKVSNLAPTSTPEELVNLFGFCGYVSGINMSDDVQSGQKIAIVEFWDKNAAITACLLSSAMVQNQPIHVELYVANDSDQQNIAANPNLKTAGAPPTVDQAARQTGTATVARVLASGFIMAKDVKDKAVAWDTGNLSLFQKAEVLGLHAKSNIEEVNRKYHITDTVEELAKIAEKKLLELKTNLEANQNYQMAKNKALEIDSQYGISITALNLFEKAKSTATEFSNEVLTEVKKQSNT